jgi:hypothetical protein
VITLSTTPRVIQTLTAGKKPLMMLISAIAIVIEWLVSQTRRITLGNSLKARKTFLNSNFSSSRSF